jgi:hypothetical protein
LLALLPPVPLELDPLELEPLPDEPVLGVLGVLFVSEDEEPLPLPLPPSLGFARESVR